MRLDPTRVAIAVAQPRINIACPPPLIESFDGRRSREPKMFRRRASRHAAVYRQNKTVPYINRKRLRHPGWLPSTDHSLNQI